MILGIQKKFYDIDPCNWLNYLRLLAADVGHPTMLYIEWSWMPAIGETVRINLWANEHCSILPMIGLLQLENLASVRSDAFEFFSRLY